MKKIYHFRNFLALFISVALSNNCLLYADTPEPDLVIIHARLIGEDGRLQPDMSISISSGKIVEISKDNKSPDAPEVIDANNRVVLPGFIDSHIHLVAHLNASNHQSMSEQVKTNVVPKLKDYFRYGVTTIKSLGDPIDAILELREQLREGGDIGPRLLTAGKVIGAKDGHPGKTLFETSPWLREQINSEINTVEQAVQAVRELNERQVDAIKIVYSGNEEGDDSYRLMNMAPPRMPAKVMQSAVSEAHRLNLPITAHTVQLEEAIAAVEAGVNGLEHGVVIEPVTSQSIDIFLKHKVTYLPTLRVTKYFLNNVSTQIPQDNLVRIARAGVPIVLGTDSGGHDLPLGNAVIEEAELMVAAGLMPLEVIRSMTENASHHLGLGDEIGTLTVNKHADIVIVDGEPLSRISDLRKIWMVIKQGQIVFNHTSL